MKYRVFFLSHLIALSSCAQMKFKDAKGLFIVITPGILPRDLDGNQHEPQRDTLYLVFVKTKSNDSTLHWIGATYNGQSYSIQSVIKNANRELAREDDWAIQQTTAISEAGYILWKLQLALDKNVQISGSKKDMRKLTIYGRLRGKTFSFAVPHLLEIPQLPRY